MDNEALATTTSPQGQPIPQDVLDQLEGGKEPEHFVTLEIDGKMGHGIYLTKDWLPTSQENADLLKVTFEDGSVSFFTATNLSTVDRKQEFYRPDQARDKEGKFEDEGKAGEITAAGVAASIKEVMEDRKNAPKPDPVLSKAIGIWTKPYADIPDVSEGEVLDSKSIRAIRDAAQQIKSGKDVKGEYGDMARALLSHSEVIPRSMMRGTSSAYFAKWDAKPEEVLSKFPIGEDVDLTLFSFTQNLDWPHSWDAPKVPFMFAHWAQDRKGGKKMFITLEKGAEGVQVERFLETGEHNPESEVITTGHAIVKSARFNKEKQQYEITLGNK